MPQLTLPVHPGLRTSTRLGWLLEDRPSESSPGLRDWAVIGLAGVGAAAASTFLDFSLRVPGHAILRVILPVMAGLALVPRRGAGTAIGTVALLTGIGFRAGGLTGGELGLGALTSLAATGPLLDWTLRRVSGGWRLYLACGLAGLVSNVLALVVRGAAKWYGLEHTGARSLARWLPQAAVTYVLCGLVAGLVCSALWFGTRRTETPPAAEAE